MAFFSTFLGGCNDSEGPAAPDEEDGRSAELVRVSSSAASLLEDFSEACEVLSFPKLVGTTTASS